MPQMPLGMQISDEYLAILLLLPFCLYLEIWFKLYMCADMTKIEERSLFPPAFAPLSACLVCGYCLS